MFQPIVDLREMGHKLHSYECLMRGPKGTSVETARVMFEYVRRKREEAVVDRACVQTAVRAAARLPGDPLISLNVHVRTLVRDRGFCRHLKKVAEECGVSPQRIVMELIENAYPCNGESLVEALTELRASGMRIALDDVGAGQSNYAMILLCQPEFLKIDAFLVQGCHADKHRVAALESIVVLARDFGSEVIAEGVEEWADLVTLSDLGIGLIQGFILAKPMTLQYWLDGRPSLEEAIVGATIYQPGVGMGNIKREVTEDA